MNWERVRRRGSRRSGCEQLVFALHQLPDFLERLVECAFGNMGVGGIDRDAGARIGLAQFAQEALVSGPVTRNVVLKIHGLKAEIETLGRRVGGLGRDGVPLAQYRRVAVDQERGARAGINENGFADHDPFKWLQFNA